jgi:hypothetical protein
MLLQFFFTFLLFGSSFGSDPPQVKIGDLGTVIGKEIKTMGNLGREPKTYFTFRNIPYAMPINEVNRFSVK